MAAISPCPPVGFDMLAGRSGSGSLASLATVRLEALLGDLALVPYETILLDLGAGLESNTRRLAAWSDTLLVVVTDEPTSLTDAYSVIKLHQSDGPGSDVRGRCQPGHQPGSWPPHLRNAGARLPAIPRPCSAFGRCGAARRARARCDPPADPSPHPPSCLPCGRRGATDCAKPKAAISGLKVSYRLAQFLVMVANAAGAIVTAGATQTWYFRPISK